MAEVQLLTMMSWQKISLYLPYILSLFVQKRINTDTHHRSKKYSISFLYMTFCFSSDRYKTKSMYSICSRFCSIMVLMLLNAIREGHVVNTLLNVTKLVWTKCGLITFAASSNYEETSVWWGFAVGFVILIKAEKKKVAESRRVGFRS